MNKTRKNKYLRKNRHSKHSKHSKHGNKKNKTRKVQRGGQNDGPGNTDVDSDINNIGDTGKGTPALQKYRVLSGNPHNLGRSTQQMKEDREARIIAQKNQQRLDMEESRQRREAEQKEEERIAAAAAAKAAAAPKPTDVLGTGEQIIIPPSVSSSSSSPPASLPFGNFGATQPTSVGFSFGGPTGGPTGGPMIISPPVPVENAHGVPITTQQHPQQQEQQQQHPQQQQQQHPQQQEQQQQETKPLIEKSTAEDTPRLTKLTPEEIKKLDPEARVAYYNQNALDYNKSRERPDRRITLIAKSLPNAILGKLAGIGSDSQKNLVKEEVLTTFTGDLSKIIEDSEDQIEVIREYNRFLNEEIKEIYREVVSNGEITDRQKQDIDDLLGHIKNNTEAMKQLTVEASMLVHAIDSGSLAGLESAFGMAMQSQAQAQVQPDTSSNKPGLLSRMFGIGKTQKNTNPENPSNGEPSSPGFLSRMRQKFTRKNKVSSDIQTPEVKAAADAHKAEQLEIDKKAGLTRVKGKTLKSRVGEGLTNIGKSVKQGFGNLKNRLTRKNNKEDTEPLIPKEEVVTKASSTTAPSDSQNKTWRDKIPKFLTRKNKNNNKEAPDTQAKVATASPPPQAPPPPPPPQVPPLPTSKAQPLPTSTSTSTSKSSFADDIKEAAEKRRTIMQTRKALPPRPSSNAPQVEIPPPPPPPPPPSSPTLPPPPSSSPETSFNTAILKNSYKVLRKTPTAPPVPARRPTPRPSEPEVDPLGGIPVNQSGGNITRKNRQYIHEIKNNRTHLFNKEMEIINSIRNFKHGLGRNEHGKNKPENIQKKFIKVIKRS